MSNKRPYSKVEELSSRAKSLFASGGDGSNILSIVVLLSAILSAIFFWQNSHLVFTNVWPPAALALGLLVGLLPAEGAFFGWKRIRGAKQDMTDKQLKATQWGLVTAVVCAIFSTIALYVSAFPSVPQEIARYADWLVFLALSIPVTSQVAIYAYFAVNERSVVENHERAKLGAMGFDAWIRSEQARMVSIIDGMDAALDRILEGYGAEVGEEEADRLLHRGSRELLEMGDRKSAGGTSPSPRRAYPRLKKGKRDVLPLSGRKRTYGVNGTGHNDENFPTA